MKCGSQSCIMYAFRILLLWAQTAQLVDWFCARYNIWSIPLFPAMDDRIKTAYSRKNRKINLSERNGQHKGHLMECSLIKSKWINKQRILVFAARGINHRDRHLMRDIKTLMPHHRQESKMERSKTLSVINEMCEIKHCNKSILFEGRRKKDLYMWFSNVPKGPSAKFLIENIHTMAELKMTGNCLRGSRPLLSFDAKFDEIPHLKLLKELFIQTFSVPNHHPKSQPFIDHIYTFTFLDEKVWFRNFQILSEDGGLAEIGPRFVMNPVKVFDGSFTGCAVWENPNYVSPSRQRQILKKVAKEKYVNRIEQKAYQNATRPEKAYQNVDYTELFDTKDVTETSKRFAHNSKAKTK